MYLTGPELSARAARHWLSDPAATASFLEAQGKVRQTYAPLTGGELAVRECLMSRANSLCASILVFWIRKPIYRRNQPAVSKPSLRRSIGFHRLPYGLTSRAGGPYVRLSHWYLKGVGCHRGRLGHCTRAHPVLRVGGMPEEPLRSTTLQFKF